MIEDNKSCWMCYEKNDLIDAFPVTAHNQKEIKKVFDEKVLKMLPHNFLLYIKDGPSVKGQTGDYVCKGRGENQEMCIVSKDMFELFYKPCDLDAE